MPRGKTGPHPISNRVSGKIGIHAKIDTDIHDILRILSMRYGGLPKAWLIEALITDWVKKTSERIGTNVIQQWADDMKEKRPLIPKEEFDWAFDELARQTSVEEEALSEALEDLREE